MANKLLKVLTIILFITICLEAQESTMEFAGTTTNHGDITVTFSTGDFVNKNVNTIMDTWSGHPWATGIDGHGDYCDISISPATYIVSITVPYEINIAGFAIQFREGGSVNKELTGFNGTSSSQSNTYLVGAVADVMRLYDVDQSNSGGIEISHITFNSTMPVELTSFSGSVVENKVVLNWETATEVNNYGFQVQRKKIKDKSEEEWESMGFVQGNGTTNSPKDYEFTDDLTLNPNHNLTRIDYRLKQIDNDGAFEYSKVVTVDLSNITSVEDEMNYEFSLEQNYPNPFNPTTTIKFTIPSDVRHETQDVRLIVFNSLGQQVATLVNEQKSPGNYEVQFDGSKLSSGIYFYKLTSGEFTQTKKLMLLK